MDEKFYKNIIEKSPMGYAYHKIILDENEVPCNYEYIEANLSFGKYTGLKIDEIIGKNVTELLPGIGDDKFDWIKYFGDIAINGGNKEYEVYSDELKRWYNVIVYCPETGYFVTVFNDITEQKKAEEDLKKTQLRYEQLAEISRTVAWEVDKNGLYTYISPVSKLVFGYKPEEMIGKMYFYDICPEDEKESFKEFGFSIINKKEIISDFEHKLQKKDNQTVWILANAFPILDDNGEVLAYRGMDIDITYLKEIEDKIKYLSFHDQLTGLYNRRFFEEELNRLDTERNFPLSLIMIDANGLKLLNDAFGHEYGDLLLNTIGDVLRRECRADDIIARVGGDEFIILLPKTDSIETRNIVDRIAQAMDKEKVEGIEVSISYGCETKNNKNESMADVYKIAETHMYKMKNSNRSLIRNNVIETILERLFERYPYEKEHSNNVSWLCFQIGVKMKLQQMEIEKIKMSGKFHDIGKIAVDKEIIAKDIDFNDDDWFHIKRHPEVGYVILSSSNDYIQFAEDVLYHHERYDGGGYPKGLVGKEIPLNSRIIAIAEAFDDMTTDRNYRPAMSIKQSVEILKQESGKQFDPDIVNVFLEEVLTNKNFPTIFT